MTVILPLPGLTQTRATASLRLPVAAGREVTHPVIRALGVVLMAVAVSSFHGLLFPETEPVSTAGAGLLAIVIVSELAGRFGEVGTFLVLLVAFGVGAVVAVDRLVLALGRAVGLLWGLARLRPAWVGALGARPDRAAPAPAGRRPRRRQAESDEEAEDAVPRRRLSAPELQAKIARLPVRMSGSPRQLPRDEDIPRQESFEDYEFPTLELLEDPESNYS